MLTTIKKSTATATTPTNNECENAVTELSRLQKDLNCLQRPKMPRNWTEVDAICSGSTHTSTSNTRPYTIALHEIISTATSIVMRVITVYLNIKLAYNYYHEGQLDYCKWTIASIVAPMCITTLIYANMCYQDGKFNNGILKAMSTLWIVFLSSFFFRYWKSLVYSIKCKRAEKYGDKEKQLKYYKLTVREESDVAFIRIFECFLEAAPQKILQISIVLRYFEDMSNMQIIAICSYLLSMAWCIAAYHRCNRYAQIDKYNINFQGTIAQICWHFCITVSRTFCISLVACLFPIWTIVACITHACLYGFVTFIVDRPKFAATSFLNFLFCLVLGIVYLFTYIAVKDAPTRLKYTVYYVTCSLENIACAFIFVFFASSKLMTLTFLHFIIIGISIVLYYFGITFQLIYYSYFHPRITARKSKRIIINK